MKKVMVNLVVGLLVGGCVAGCTLLGLLLLEALGMWSLVMVLLFVGLWMIHGLGEAIIRHFKKDGG